MEKKNTLVGIVFKRYRNGGTLGERNMEKKMAEKKHEVLEVPQDRKQRKYVWGDDGIQ